MEPGRTGCGNRRYPWKVLATQRADCRQFSMDSLSPNKTIKAEIIVNKSIVQIKNGIKKFSAQNKGGKLEKKGTENKPDEQ